MPDKYDHDSPEPQSRLTALETQREEMRERAGAAAEAIGPIDWINPRTGVECIITPAEIADIILKHMCPGGNDGPCLTPPGNLKSG